MGVHRDPPLADEFQRLTFFEVTVLLSKVQYELPPLEPQSPVTARMSPEDVASRITALKAKPVEQLSVFCANLDEEWIVLTATSRPTRS